MSRPYNAWAAEPTAHRHLGPRFVDNTRPSGFLPPPESMVTSPPIEFRPPAPLYYQRPAGPIASYRGPYGPGPPLQTSPGMPPAPPPYRIPGLSPHQQPHVFPDPGRALPHSLIDDGNRGPSYIEPRVPRPPQDGLPPHRRQHSFNEYPPPPRPPPSIDHSQVNRRTSAAPIVTTRTQNPLASPTSARGPIQTTVPNLLGDGRADVIKDIKFTLKLRQQPKAARSCGFGERDRRVIDPPPIIELIIENPALSEDEIRTYRCYESYVMSCSIWDETGTRDASYMPEEYRHQRRLMGSLVGTPFVGKDEHGQEGCFFTFADLSCRTPGCFRLKFSVIMIDPIRAGMIRHFPILTEIQSDVFTVYNAKDFPGMVASTQLAHSLKAQGCILQLKKGNDKGRGSRGGQDMSDDDDDDFDDDLEASHGRRKRRSIR